MVRFLRARWWRRLLALAAERSAGSRNSTADMKECQLQYRSNMGLTDLISTHKACLARRGMQSCGTSDVEIKLRSFIIAYEPRDKSEALLRLAYLFALVATANVWLSGDKIGDLLDEIPK